MYVSNGTSAAKQRRTARALIINEKAEVYVSLVLGRAEPFIRLGRLVSNRSSGSRPTTYNTVIPKVAILG